MDDRALAAYAEMKAVRQAEHDKVVAARAAFDPDECPIKRSIHIAPVAVALRVAWQTDLAEIIGKENQSDAVEPGARFPTLSSELGAQQVARSVCRARHLGSAEARRSQADPARRGSSGCSRSAPSKSRCGHRTPR